VGVPRVWVWVRVRGVETLTETPVSEASQSSVPTRTSTPAATLWAGRQRASPLRPLQRSSKYEQISCDVSRQNAGARDDGSTW
jgi:hypothetical protein